MKQDLIDRLEAWLPGPNGEPPKNEGRTDWLQAIERDIKDAIEVIRVLRPSRTTVYPVGYYEAITDDEDRVLESHAP